MLYMMLWAWAVYRHPNKKKHWSRASTGESTRGEAGSSSPPTAAPNCTATSTRRSGGTWKAGSRSLHDGDWVYWSSRLGRHPDVSPRVARLLKRQQGTCRACKLFFSDGDVMEVDHIIPKTWGGTERHQTSNCSIDIVTRRKRPERLAHPVRMTTAKVLRSRMNGNVHVRF